MLQKHRRRSSLAFAGSFDASRKVVVSLLPGESNEAALRYQLYKNRFAKLAGLTSGEVERVMPKDHEDWRYEDKGPDWDGFEGFITDRDEIDRLAAALNPTARS